MVEFRRATARVAPATIGPALTGGSPMSGGGEQRSPRVLRLRNTAVVIATAGTLVITGGCGSSAVPCGPEACPADRPRRS